MAAKHIKPIVNPNIFDAPVVTTPVDVMISGNGATQTLIPFQSADTSVISGIWESQAFSKKKAHPDEMEFCYLIEGEVKLSDLDGNYSEFSAGDAFVVEPGFEGTWESKTAVRKYFVIAKCQ